MEADYVLVTVGRRPNTDEIGLEELGIKFAERGLIEVDKQCRTSISNIFAIGDVVAGPQLAHKASYEGKVAARGDCWSIICYRLSCNPSCLLHRSRASYSWFI